MERAWKRIATIAVLVIGGCAAPRVELDDSGSPISWRDGAIADGGTDARSAPAVRRVESVGGGAPLLPLGGAPTTSPPACPGPDDPTFCHDCYAWDDGGPDSLERNQGGDEFGYVISADLNGDGYVDLAVGSPGEPPSEDEGGAWYGEGAVHLFLGSASGFLPWRRIRSYENVERFGRSLAAGDFDDDGDTDLAVGHVDVNGGVGSVLLLSNDEGTFVDMVTVPGDTLEFGVSMVATRWDGSDFTADLVIGIPDEGWGAIGVYNTGAEELTVYDAFYLDGALAAFPEIGRSLAIWGSYIAVGAPGVSTVYFIMPPITSGQDEWWEIVESLEGPPGASGWGATLAVRELEMLVGSFGPRAELLDGEPSSVTRQTFALAPLSTSTVRAVAIADIDAFETRELFGVEDIPGNVAPIRIYMEGYLDGTWWLEPDAQPVRVADDRVGATSVVGDWNFDGYDDIALGAAGPGTASPGMVFGYMGGYIDFDVEAQLDNHVDFEDSYFLVDQESPACDRCQAMTLDEGEPCPAPGPGVCLDHECVERTGCGDGWREPGPDPSREACDDRNLADGDGCSSACMPTPFVIAARADAIDVPTSDRSVAIDGSGRVLVVWSEENETSTRVRARRYTRYGTDPEGTPTIIEIASLAGPGWNARPVVNALADGWAIAWRQPAGSEVAAIVAARVGPDGVVGAPIRVSSPSETLGDDPSIASLDDGTLVVTWTDATSPTSPTVRYRWIDGSGVRGDPVAVDSRAGGDPVVAAVGGTAMIVWTEEPDLGERPRVVARRFTRTADLDAAPVLIGANASQPTVSGGASQFAIGWVGREDDPDGDIFARVVPSSGAITGVGAHVTTVADADRPLVEREPSIVAHGTGWLIAWEVPTRRAARLAAGGGATLPSEQPSLDDGLHQHLSLASSSRGTWMLWSSVLDDPPVEHAEIVADADTYVNEGAPTTTYGTVGHLRAGRLGDTGGGATGRKDAYIHWDLSAFRGVTVVDASLRFAQSDAGNDPVGMSFLAAESPWTESTLTWATRVDPDGPVLASVVAPPVTVGSGLFEIGGSAVIGEVRRWTQAPSANFGIVVQMTGRDAGTSGDTLRSRNYTVAGERPTLRFDYQRPAAARATWAFILPPS